MPLIPSNSPNLPPLFDEIPPTSLAVTHAFMSICNVSGAKNTDVIQSNVEKMANDVRKLLKGSFRYPL